MDTVIRGKPTVADLGDIELEAVVELGRTGLPLREARALKTGDVVTMKKLAGEAMKVSLNGHPFGEGEIVIVYDLMCVRLTRLEEPIEARQRDAGQEEAQ